MSGGRNTLALVLALVLALNAACLGCAALAEENGALPEGYERIAQNSRFNLYLKKDTLALIVESRQSGKLLYSTVQNPDEMKDNATWKGFYQSGIVMEYLDGV